MIFANKYVQNSYRLLTCRIRNRVAEPESHEHLANCLHLKAFCYLLLTSNSMVGIDQHLIRAASFGKNALFIVFLFHPFEFASPQIIRHKRSRNSRFSQKFQFDDGLTTVRAK